MFTRYVPLRERKGHYSSHFRGVFYLFNGQVGPFSSLPFSFSHNTYAHYHQGLGGVAPGHGGTLSLVSEKVNVAVLWLCSLGYEDPGVVGLE